MILADSSTSSDDNLVSIYETPFWGVLFSISLMGITAMQAWTYFNTNYNEPLLRILVIIVISLDLANVVIDAMSIKYYFIINYGNPIAFESLPSYMSIESIITAIIVFLVHLFFASRVYLISHKNKFAFLFVLTTATVAFVAGVVKSVNTLYNPAIAHFNSKPMLVEVVLRAVAAAACDVAVTVILVRALRQSQEGIVFKSTRNIIQSLLRFIMTRGILVTLTQVALLILYAFNAEKLYWSILHFSLTRVYVISMVSMLNARSELQKNLNMDTGNGTDTGDHVSFIHPSSIASLRPPTFVMTGIASDLEIGAVNLQKTISSTHTTVQSETRTHVAD